jgi:hypothetical protein
MTSTTSADAYVPGICNINHAEIAYRRKAGYAGLVAFVVIAAVLFGLSANRYTRLVLKTNSASHTALLASKTPLTAWQRLLRLPIKLLVPKINNVLGT